MAVSLVCHRFYIICTYMHVICADWLWMVGKSNNVIYVIVCGCARASVLHIISLGSLCVCVCVFVLAIFLRYFVYVAVEIDHLELKLLAKPQHRVYTVSNSLRWSLFVGSSLESAEKNKKENRYIYIWLHCMCIGVWGRGWTFASKKVYKPFKGLWCLWKWWVVFA